MMLDPEDNAGEQMIEEHDLPKPMPVAGSERFHSILFPGAQETEPQETSDPPVFFHDLNLDQIVEAVTAEWQDYNLLPFFYTPLRDPRTIAYRQDVMKDLEDDALMQAIQAFSGGMTHMRQILSQADDHYKYDSERHFLDAAAVYCRAVSDLSQDLVRLDPASPGMRAFRSYLTDYVSSAKFQELTADTTRLVSDLSSIHYCLIIKEGNVTVRSYDSEEDYSATVERIFAKFRQAGARDYRVSNLESARMNHIQAQVVEQLARLYPRIFESMVAFSSAHADYLDGTISRFDREVQFYVAYLTHIAKFRRAGLSFCYPRLSRTSKEVESHESFDLALAAHLLKDGATVVTNDFFLRGSERMFVISGPNQGGKTTFARMFGQLHYLACLGCPVPGKEARLFLFDHLFTHFEKEEDIETLRGKLADDLVRIRRILDQATPDSIVVMNEAFSSTTLKDAVYLSKEIMAKLSALDLLGACVTFLDEIASFNEKTVSVVSTVDPSNPAVRTYKLVRKPADGLAYALAVAQKHRVTYDWLRKRMAS
jgi:DNA mismatch repair protein MutS